MSRELPRGDLPTLILAVLEQGPAHGYAIARTIERLSEDALHVNEGSLYPALRALERDGTISSAWVVQERGPARRVYTLNEAGKHSLVERAREFERYVAAISAVLGPRRLANG